MSEPYDNDWIVLRTAAEDLKNYLLSNELYWPLPGISPSGLSTLQRLTPGIVRLAQRRLCALPLTPQDQRRLDILQPEIESTIEHWRTAWRSKAAREFTARRRLWQDYLQDLAIERGKFMPAYEFSVQWRVILSLIADEAAGISGVETAQLAGLDQQLRTLSHPGPFVWREELQNAFPRTEFWYLYIKAL